MRYFGKRSLSSTLSTVLHVSWIIVLVIAVLAPFAAGGIIYLSTPSGEQALASVGTHCGAKTGNPSETIDQAICGENSSDKDQKDWQSFKNTHIALKLLMIPYLEGVLILLLVMIRKSRKLFINFTNDLVFSRENVPLISTISKLNIAFAILTFSFTTLLISVVLFMLCELVKTGAVLQEEHDLTI